MDHLYIELPQIYKTYLKSDIVSIVNDGRNWKNLGYHDVFCIPQSDVLTKEGLVRFAAYRNLVDIFRMPPFYSSRIHTDKSYHAFNFIITDNGGMEWFDLADLEEDTKSGIVNAVYKLPAQSPIAYTESNMMLVQTRVPHRIVNNSDRERICVSIRMVMPVPFDDVLI